MAVSFPLPPARSFLGAGIVESHAGGFYHSDWQPVMGLVKNSPDVFACGADRRRA